MCEYEVCNTYEVLSFHDVVAMYSKTGNPSEYLMDEAGIKKAGRINYRAIVEHKNRGGLFLQLLFVGDSDMSIFYYNGFRIEIQPHDEGWDYTIYERDGREWDGGIYDDMEAPMSTVLSEAIKDVEKYCTRK